VIIGYLATTVPIAVPILVGSFPPCYFHAAYAVSGSNSSTNPTLLWHAGGSGAGNGRTGRLPPSGPRAFPA